MYKEDFNVQIQLTPIAKCKSSNVSRRHAYLRADLAPWAVGRLYKSIELREERLINSRISLQVCEDLKCKQRARRRAQSHAGASHPFSALTGLWVGWLHSCREKYRRTIGPVRYTLPAVHTAAGPSSWWNVTLIHLPGFLLRFVNTSLTLGNQCDDPVTGWWQLGTTASAEWWRGDAAALGWTQRGNIQRLFSSVEAFRLLLPKQPHWGGWYQQGLFCQVDSVDFQRKVPDNIEQWGAVTCRGPDDPSHW